jgi:hypothetical protein
MNPSREDETERMNEHRRRVRESRQEYLDRLEGFSSPQATSVETGDASDAVGPPIQENEAAVAVQGTVTQPAYDLENAEAGPDHVPGELQPLVQETAQPPTIPLTPEELRLGTTLIS